MSEKELDDSADWLEGLRQDTDVDRDGPPGFVLDDLLGRGGMAEVYLAHRTGPMGFSRKVVIKRIRPDKVAEPLYVERFLREATISSQFHHPHIVEILELVTQDDAWYIVMEFLHGMHLGRVIERLNRARTHCPAEFAAHIGSGVASALDYAHNFVGEDGRTHQIVHRDISPENIMVTFAGEVKLVDFGVAKDLQGTVLTVGDQVIGKPLYLSPEALQGAPATPARDLYALGMTLYVILAGRPPFASKGGPEGLAKLMVEISTKEPPKLSDFNPKIPVEIEAIIHDLLSKRPSDRPTAAETHRALEGWLAKQKRVTTSTVSDFVKSLVDDEEELKPPQQGGAGQIISPDPTPPPRPVVRSTKRPSPQSAPAPTPEPMPSLSSKGWTPDPAPARAAEETTAYASEPTANAAEPARERTKLAKAPSAPRVYGGAPEVRKGLRVRHMIAAGGGLILLIIIAILAWPSSPPEPVEVPVADAGLPEVDDVAPPVLPEAAPVTPSDVVAGTLTVKCGSWGWIAVDGRRVGMCPSVSVSISAGAHTVALEGGAKARSKTAVVAAGRTTVVDLTPPTNKAKPKDIIIRPTAE